MILRIGRLISVAWLGTFLVFCNASASSAPPELSETMPLQMTGDIASDLVDGVDRFLLRRLEESIDLRLQQWPVPKVASVRNSSDYAMAIEPLRNKLRDCLGMVDQRLAPGGFRIETLAQFDGDSANVSNHLLQTESHTVCSVRWRVFEGVDGSGLMVIPKQIQFCAVVIPDAGQSPAELCGALGESQSFVIELAKRGGLVIVPSVIRRQPEARNGRSVLTDQEYLYRSAFVLGRHTLGYEVNETLSAIDNLKQSLAEKPILVAGWGEGGWIAMHAAALDSRIDVACVSGHFGTREQIWKEPIHRNVHGLLRWFGDAQLAAMIAPRTLILESIPGPTVRIDGKGAAPGELSGPAIEAVSLEWRHAERMLAPWQLEDRIAIVSPSSSGAKLVPMIGSISNCMVALQEKIPSIKNSPDPTERASVPWRYTDTSEVQRRETLSKWDRFQQRILESVHIERDVYWNKLDSSSLGKFKATVEPYRASFQEDIIGKWDIELQTPNPRTRLLYERDKWLGYEVVLDVFDGVIAYGVLLVPKGDSLAGKRPCVVFQHGLEGRPTDTIVGDNPAYHDVAVQLVEQGYAVFAPQNLYLFGDRFRSLQRKSNPLGKTLFSTIVAQHQQIVRWLQSRPEIEPDKIAFYGLSYGGKSAMRIPALVPGYCLSICSADFNDWVWKNASTISPYSYVWTNEYEIFEFNLGRTFNYAEMATLIAPRPFMVERGHFDGVAPDERVGLEFAKVQRLYSARLGLKERCRIEWFAGPHTIHGVETLAFLREHLQR